MKKITAKHKKNRIRDIAITYIVSNLKIYVTLLIVLFIGIILGVIYVNNMEETQMIQTSEYINNFVSSMKEDYQVSTTKLLYTSIINNSCSALILWLLGLTVIGMPFIYLIIGYKGYCLGYTVSSIVATLGSKKGIIFVFATMILQNLIYIPAIITLAVSGINLYKLIMEDKRKENIKIQIFKHTVFSTLMLIMLLISAVIETYISGNLTQILRNYY